VCTWKWCSNYSCAVCDAGEALSGEALSVARGVLSLLLSLFDYVSFGFETSDTVSRLMLWLLTVAVSRPGIVIVFYENISITENTQYIKII